MIGPLPIYYGLAAGPTPTGEAWLITDTDEDGPIFWCDLHTDEDAVLWSPNPNSAAFFATMQDALTAYSCRGLSEGELSARAVCVEMA